MNSSSTNLVYVDAAGWIALVNRRDALHTQAVRIYKERLQEQYQIHYRISRTSGGWKLVVASSFARVSDRPSAPHRAIKPG